MTYYCAICIEHHDGGPAHFHCPVQNLDFCKKCVWGIRGNQCPCNSHEIPWKLANQSVRYVRLGVKCPGCGARVENTGQGGNVVACLCNQLFCYRCGHASDTFDCTQACCRAGWLRRFWNRWCV